MKLTKYTKYVLEDGGEITVKIANTGFSAACVAKLESVGAYYKEGRGWLIDLNKENYQKRCYALGAGFKMEYFTMKHK